MSTHAIEIHGLTKTFGSTRAVNDLSFTVEPGNVVGFLGPNGSGKTTTLRALLGFISADSGTALVEGVPFTDLPDPARSVGAVSIGHVSADSDRRRVQRTTSSRGKSETTSSQNGLGSRGLPSSLAASRTR